MRHPAFPLTPALSHNGRGVLSRLQQRPFPLREKDRMRV